MSCRDQASPADELERAQMKACREMLGEVSGFALRRARFHAGAKRQ
jgi:hypothetical protein